MRYGETLKEVAATYNITHSQIAVMVNDERSTVTKRCNGDRPMTEHFVKTTCQNLKHPVLYLEAIGEMFEGTFYFPWLNGEELDLSIKGIDEKIREEINEMFAVSQCRAKGKREEVIYKDKALAEKEADETIDAIHCLIKKLTKICLLSGISIEERFQSHTEKLIEKGYLKKEKAPASAHARG